MCTKNKFEVAVYKNENILVPVNIHVIRYAYIYNIHAFLIYIYIYIYMEIYIHLVKMIYTIISFMIFFVKFECLLTRN